VLSHVIEADNVMFSPVAFITGTIVLTIHYNTVVHPMQIGAVACGAFSQTARIILDVFAVLLVVAKGVITAAGEGCEAAIRHAAAADYAHCQDESRDPC
jgi:hypothetical protein